MAIFKNLVKALTGNDEQTGSKEPQPEPAPESPPETAAETVDEPVPEPAPKPPRVVIEAYRINDASEADDSNAVLIKAKPSQDNSECRFALNRVLFEGKAWFFSSRGATRGCALAEAVFAADEDIESVLIHNTWVTVTRLNKAATDWKPLAEAVGGALRSFLENNTVEIPTEIVEAILPDDELRKQVQAVIDEEINPGVAGHGGVISIVSAEGNVITINMGGGCQGCSSAAMTLKGGIERAFRDRVPSLGAILDATDHASGSNPYFS